MSDAETKWVGSTLMPMLAYEDAPAAIEWYKQAFGATETARLTDKQGNIVFASIEVCGATVAVSPVYPGYSTTPKALGGCSVVLNLTVPDVDAFFARAIAAGATEKIPVSDQFYGERTGRLEDPFGHLWIIATATEQLSVAEMQKRLDEMG